MDITRVKRHGLRLAALAILVACAWLISSQIGLAASSGSNLSVHVRVMDSVGSRIGSPAVSGAYLQNPGQDITRKISRIATFGLAGAVSDTVAESDNFASLEEIVITTIKF
jgi:hypothetical protein